MFENQPLTICVIGLGYVGLPLAAAFGAKYRTIGFDIKSDLVENLKKFKDPTGELSEIDLKSASQLSYTSDPAEISQADMIIIAVPTPIDIAQRPDFHPLISASETAGKHMKSGSTVVFESTVYPGATEEVCVPILEKTSGLIWKQDFHVGYSPERINPGDKEHTLTKITKVVSGDDAQTLKQIEALYGSIVSAGVYPTQSIKEAEAAKVIENTQRDLNIALINELALIFDKLGIDTLNVLKAAGTKWNFLPFRPGLVGGHCIGVDPYYLTYKAQTIGYHPEVILAGRKINDSMGKFIAEKTVKSMIHAGRNIKNANVAVLGLTFKEDCSDLRNTKVVDIVRELESYGVNVRVHDPLADSGDAQKYYGIQLTAWDKITDMDAVVIATPHKTYRDMPLEAFTEKLNASGSIIDVKSILDPDKAAACGHSFWRL